jgi:uncharacterized protein
MVVGGNSRSQRDSDVNSLETYWDAGDSARALRAVVHAFETNVASINALNVFPVPDGDTGTNMHLTLKAAISELDHLSDGQPERFDEMMETVSRGALMGARGNSGVILYQIISGMNQGARGSDVLDSQTLVKGLSCAAELAYKAVTNPVEGTMLTVMREIASACEKHPGDTILETLTVARKAADLAVKATPEQLPVLRQAGVVDAGGQGLLTIFTTMEQYATGDLDTAGVSLVSEPPSSFASDMHFLDQEEMIHGMEAFGYCINFAVAGENLESSGLRAALDALGQSTVIVGDDSICKVHTHSEKPGLILDAALMFGDLHNVRIDNMRSQTEQLLSERHSTSAAVSSTTDMAPAPEFEYEIGIVAVAAGAGIADALTGLGVNTIVSGGATMNPSTGEIREAIESLGRPSVIVLPNDSNIIASARQAAELSELQVRVVPTTSIQQCIGSLSAFNFDADLDDNAKAMEEAAGAVRALALTRAQRDAVINGLEFRSGEFMGVLDGNPRISGKEAAETLRDLLYEASASDYELATVFLGEPADDHLVDTVSKLFAGEFPDLEVEITPGGQPHYDLLIALE